MSENFWPEEYEGKVKLTIAWSILGVVCFVVSAITSEFVPFMVGAIFAGVAIYGGIQAYNQRIDEKQREDHLQYEEKKKKEEQEIMEKRFASGTWDFPKEKFYNLCKDNAIKDLNDPFTMQKACLLAASLLEDAGVPKQYHNIYVSGEKVKEYYTSWNEILEEKKRKEQEEFERKSREPQRARPDATELKIINGNKALYGKHGIDKRTAMFDQEIAEITNAIRMLEREITVRDRKRREAQQAIDQLGFALQAASRESTKNWGFAGGIASALGGPAAGIVAASDVMRENAAIEARNQQNSAYYAKMTANMMISLGESKSLSTYELEKEKTKLEERRTEIREEQKKNRTKVVLEGVDKEALLSYIKPELKEVARNKNDVLEIELTVANSYVPKVPDGVKIVMDGNISLEVYSGDICVGSAYAPLPLYGIPCGESGTVKALCTNYLEGTPKYTVRYTYNDLWVMEL